MAAFKIEFANGRAAIEVGLNTKSKGEKFFVRLEVDGDLKLKTFAPDDIRIIVGIVAKMTETATMNILISNEAEDAEMEKLLEATEAKNKAEAPTAPTVPPEQTHSIEDILDALTGLDELEGPN